MRYAIPKVGKIDDELSSASLPKHAEVMREFHERVQRGEPRLSLLVEFAKRKAWRLTSYRQMRPLSLGMRRGVSPCFVCSRPGHIRHHVIQVQHGGRNKGSNLVRLCKECHDQIHPWMQVSQ